MTYLKPITKKQYQLLLYIADYIWQHGYPPERKEMAYHMGVTSVAPLLTALDKKGYINAPPRKPIRLLHVPGFPHARQFHNGQPSFALEALKVA